MYVLWTTCDEVWVLLNLQTSQKKDTLREAIRIRNDYAYPNDEEVHTCATDFIIGASSKHVFDI